MQSVGASVWPRSPGAPTIGTATAGASSATVTYTAPSDLGAGSITYTAISTPGSFTGTGASPITVSGLTNGTAYTFKVTAATPGGTGPVSAASNSVTPLAIGDAYGGGYFAGQISTAGNSVADYNLVVGPVASAQSTLQFKIVRTSDPGALSVIDGPANSASMNDASHPAAQFCEGLTIGGFSDWYMPAKNELEVCYYNLKPTTTNNNTTTGINSNAVPARASNYTSGTPAQTSAAAFVTSTGAEAFSSVYYWSSTEVAGFVKYAWLQSFNDGFQSGATYYKNDSKRVRAIRRVAV